MNKCRVAVFFGGRSSEYGVSLQSASAVIRNLDRGKYEPILVGMTRDGKWYHYTGDVTGIQNDTWWESDCTPAALAPGQLLLLKKAGVETIAIDVAFPVLHGKNGEDGTLQGAVELAGIPLAGCGVLASALCMDKDRAHKLAGLAGVRVPRALVLDETTQPPADFEDKLGYPLYVKPVKAGSSYGITKVEEKGELTAAIALALQYDDAVIVEEGIEGFEVGCAVLGTHDLLTGEVDEIELAAGFFDYEEKYTLKTSAIHVPARISKEQADAVKETAKHVYRALGCSGFARVDLFLTPDGGLVFNEVNTIPGFTEHSRYPAMMQAAGYSFAEVLDRILAQAAKG